MKIKKQQFAMESLGGFLHKEILKHRIQKRTEKLEKIRCQLILDLELFNHYNFSSKEIIRWQEKQRKKQIYENIDEAIEYIGINSEMKELTVEEVAGEVMECVDMDVNPKTIDQTLSEEDSNEEDLYPKGEPAISCRLKIGDLIERKVNHMYYC